MDGIHDLGGMEGFGPVDVEPDEPTFHHEWEGRVFAMAGGALGAGGFNTPMFRHSIERMRPEHYLGSGYYEHWLTGVASLLTEAGIVTVAELTARAGSFPRSFPARATGEDVASAFPTRAARTWSTGDHVRVRDVHFSGHTRCPRYVRGRVGTIVARGPDAPRPEDEAHCDARVPEATYTVQFDGHELWGDGADAGHVVIVDLYAHYLEPA